MIKKIKTCKNILNITKELSVMITVVLNQKVVTSCVTCRSCPTRSFLGYFAVVIALAQFVLYWN